MAKGSWAATAADSVLVAADTYRGSIELQHTAGSPVFIGFGEAGVVGQGIKFAVTSPYYLINDHRARMAIHGICDTGLTASGGYQTA